MDNDLKTKATHIFNGLNRYLNLLNYRPSDNLKLCSFGSSNFFDPLPSNLDSKCTHSYDDLTNSIAKDFDFDINVNTILSDILLEDDSLGLDPFATLSYANKVDNVDEAADSSFASQESQPIDDAPLKVEELDAELASNLISERPNDTEDKVLIGSSDSNFINFTYWSLETGENVSNTSNPLYFNDKNCTVSLLQESEAFVANVLWNSHYNFKHTPRHLLFQVTQIANRAFFDPDYRKYLQLNYV